MASKKKKREAYHGPQLSPMVRLADTLRPLPGRPLAGMAVRRTRAIDEGFRIHVARIADLEGRDFGAWDHLEAAYNNFFLADEAVRSTAELIQERGGNPMTSVRANMAGTHVLLASDLLSTATIIYVRPSERTPAQCLILARSALECVGRGVLLAYATGDEDQRWLNGHELRAADCVRALAPIVARANGSASDPYAVYRWLCHFTHTTAKGFELMTSESRSEAYCGIAYVSWVVALVAEDVTGVPDLAKYPVALPAKLPWD